MIVADTNLLAYLFLPGEHTAAAQAVVRKDPAWAAPLLWRSEFRNVLAGYLRRGTLSLEETVAAHALAEEAVRGREYAVETSAVLDLVQRSRCSAYDCEFVALAEDLGVPLVTSDARILQSFPAIAVSPADFIA